MKKFEGKFHLEIGEPSVIMQGAVGDQAWGHYQFPSLMHTRNGGIYAGWGYNNDDIDYKAAPAEVITNKVSDDGGKTWRKTEPTDRTVGFKMKNGKIFGGFRVKGAYVADYITKYTPVKQAMGKDFYFAEDIAEDEDKRVWAREVDPETGKSEEFECKINWPNLHLAVHRRSVGGMLYPTTMVFALHACQSMLNIDGDMYAVTYTGGFDAEAKKEDAVGKYTGYSGVYVFKSTDCGRTWDYVSQILVDDDTFNPAPHFEGLDEPNMKIMPDGSVVMLIRTGSNHPCYIVRSTDNCKTWSKPVKFDDIGVLPQLLVLDCGITIASYGRPVLKVRATDDAAGMEWQDPIQLDLYGMKMENPFQRSCFYTKLLAIDDTTAMLIYTDFQYPNPDGEGVKSVLVRTIKVIPD